MVFLTYNTHTSKTKNYSTYEKWKRSLISFENGKHSKDMGQKHHLYFERCPATTPKPISIVSMS